MPRITTTLLVPVLALALVGCSGSPTEWNPAGGNPAAGSGGGGAGGGGGAPPDTTPPTAPASLTATSLGDARIDLSWSPSVDDVGVTGYRVERCQGSACANFAEIAAVAASPYSDTTSLAASSTYRYRVKALDGAGNRSGYSTIVSATTQAASGGVLPVGPLQHDGPATPEQISLFLPVTGPLSQATTATVRYRQTGTPTWTIGHPLYRIRPDLTDLSQLGVGTVPDAFAWPIIDVLPGTSYDIEVTVNNGPTTNVLTLTHTTRALPAAAAAPNKIIAAGSTTVQIQAAMDALNPGDVIQFADGTYNLSASLTLTRNGTPANPIYIQGQSRAGVVISNPSRVILLDASHVVIENLTLLGSGVDSGTNASSQGIQLESGVARQTRVTVRNVTIRGVDVGIKAYQEIQEFLAYDNTLIGNNTWTALDTTRPPPVPRQIDTNADWNDDGINIPGYGNAAFNNSLRGMGDNFSFDTEQLSTDSVGVHFYRNNVAMGGDDGTEVDGGHRNLSFYDNRLRNTMTFVSLDPIFGGPLLVARNVAINTGRTPFKWNSPNSGQFIYNNTILRTLGKYAVFDGTPDAESGWYQANNGDQRSYGYRNNILVYRGVNTPLQTIRLDNSGHDPVDFTNNSWFPDAIFQWPQGRFLNLASAFASLAATTPLFGGQTHRHDQDNITVTNPWTTAITIGPDYHTEVTNFQLPILAPGTAPKNSGVIIPNITDGFAGGAPDRGALIEGRTFPTVGDRRAATEDPGHVVQ